MKTTKVKLIPTTLKLLLLGCMAVTFSSNSALGYGPSEPIDSVVFWGGPPFLDFNQSIKKPKLKNDRPQRSRRNADVRPNVDGQKHPDFWLLPSSPERSRPTVDGQKYDDRDPSSDPCYWWPEPSKRSRPNVNGRPNADRQGNGGLIGIPKTGGHLKRPTPIPPPAEPYQIDKHGKIRFSEHSPEKKRTVIVRDSPPPNSTRVVRPRKSN